ncbi:hypothetical protein [Nocardia asteroides]|uniref:hypothetical protein n=1 Tax=Nocardia asteroides TaxID=1824 RepID=UPI0033F7145B
MSARRFSTGAGGTTGAADVDVVDLDDVPAELVDPPPSHPASTTEPTTATTTNNCRFIMRPT